MRRLVPALLLARFVLPVLWLAWTIAGAAVPVDGGLGPREVDALPATEPWEIR